MYVWTWKYVVVERARMESDSTSTTELETQIARKSEMYLTTSTATFIATEREVSKKEQL